MSIKLGQLKKVVNKSRHFGSTNEYNLVYVTRDSKIVPLLLTDGELENARNRARNNKEDIPKVSLSLLQWIKLLWS